MIKIIASYKKYYVLNNHYGAVGNVFFKVTENCFYRLQKVLRRVTHTSESGLAGFLAISKDNSNNKERQYIFSKLKEHRLCFIDGKR